MEKKLIVSVLSAIFFSLTFTQLGFAEDIVTWESYNVITQDDPDQMAFIIGSDGTEANLKFYESINDDGVWAPADTLEGYTSGEHVESFNHMESYWGKDYPYAGISNVGRGYDESEANIPAPMGHGIRDLQLHPPANNHLMVAAFKIPAPGDYKIKNLAVRRVSSNGKTVQLKVFDPAKNLLTTLTASNNQDWTVASDEFTIFGLYPHMSIYFAVDNLDGFEYDATEIAFTIEKRPDEEAPKLSVNTGHLDFGEVAVGTSKTMNVEMTNTGGSTLVITNAWTDDSQFTASGPSFPCNVEPNETVTYAVAYAPSSATPMSTTLGIRSNTASGYLYLSIRGEGIEESLPRLWAMNDANDNGVWNWSTTFSENGSYMEGGNQWNDIPIEEYFTGPYGNYKVEMLKFHVTHNGYGYAGGNITTSVDEDGLEPVSQSDRDEGKSLSSGLILHFVSPDSRISSFKLKLIDIDGNSSKSVLISDYSSSYCRYFCSVSIPMEDLANESFDFRNVWSITPYIDNTVEAGDYTIRMGQVKFQ